MIRENAKRKMKWGAGLLALALAVALPVLAVAEATTQAPVPATESSAMTPPDGTGGANLPAQPMGRGGRGFGMGGYGLSNYGLDASALTDEQKAAYDSALALYEQVEDGVLADLVTAGVVAQADVDAYAAQREAQKSLAELDPSAWTADQYKAFYEANQRTGDERTAAMQALVTAGQLTQAQADALSAQGQETLWTRVSQNAGTNSAIQTALQTMQQARQTMNRSLSAAGIQGMGRGGMFGGSGMGKGFDRGQNGNQGDNSNTRGGKGGRR